MKSTNQRDHCEWGDLYPQSFSPIGCGSVPLCFDWGGWLYEFQVRMSQFLENSRLLWSILFLYALMNSIWFRVFTSFFLFICFSIHFLYSLTKIPIPTFSHRFSSLCVYVTCWVKSTICVPWEHSSHRHCHTVNHSTVNRYHFFSAVSSLAILPIKTRYCRLLQE